METKDISRISDSIEEYIADALVAQTTADEFTVDNIIHTTLLSFEAAMQTYGPVHLR